MTQHDERQRQEPTTAVVARRVQELRKAQGLSAQELAERLAQHWPELDRSILANLESGRRRSVSVDEVLVLALALNVAPVHLFVPVTEEPVHVGAHKIPSPVARDWVRGGTPLEGQDARLFRTQVPESEWADYEASRDVPVMSAAELARALAEAGVEVQYTPAKAPARKRGK